MEGVPPRIGIQTIAQVRREGGAGDRPVHAHTLRVGVAGTHIDRHYLPHPAIVLAVHLQIQSPTAMVIKSRRTNIALTLLHEEAIPATGTVVVHPFVHVPCIWVTVIRVGHKEAPLVHPTAAQMHRGDHVVHNSSSA